MMTTTLPGGGGSEVVDRPWSQELIPWPLGTRLTLLSRKGSALSYPSPPIFMGLCELTPSRFPSDFDIRRREL